MGITITRGSGKTFRPGFTVTRKSDPLKRMWFDGPLLDRPVQFPEDVAFMKSWLRGRGLAVGDKDCQALWVRLSLDHYPFDRDPGSYAWLTAGLMTSLLEEHAMQHLVASDAPDVVR